MLWFSVSGGVIQRKSDTLTKNKLSRLTGRLQGLPLTFTHRLGGKWSSWGQLVSDKQNLEMKNINDRSGRLKCWGTNVKSNWFQLSFHFHKKKVGLLAYFTISVGSSTAISIYDIGEHFLKDGIHPYNEYLRKTSFKEMPSDILSENILVTMPSMLCIMVLPMLCSVWIVQHICPHFLLFIFEDLCIEETNILLRCILHSTIQKLFYTSPFPSLSFILTYNCKVINNFKL